MAKLFMPALRGRFGDWIYYSCLMPASLVAKRVNFAKELHKNTKLSELIQRELKEGRGVEIAKYLRNEKERFFNSLVVAVYDGKPSWYDFDIESRNKKVSVEDIPDFALHSFGFLCLEGKEKLFALDGQHRLAGIKKAFSEGGAIEDEISLILVAHANTLKGLERTRRLFTTLNKTAVAVSKAEKIALDENDLMAIVVRKLVEDNLDFTGDRIAYRPTNNLAPNDLRSLTTIGNLYDILGILFAKVFKKGTLKTLQYVRPSDNDLAESYANACQFFDLLREHIPELNEFFEASDISAVVQKYRGPFGGSLVFRPIGLSVLTESIGLLSKKYPLEDCVQMVAQVPRDLAAEPLAEVLWDTKARVILPRGRVLARTLLLYMLGEANASHMIRKRYADALGEDVSKVALPPVLGQ